MSSNQFNNNASNKVVINFNDQPTNFDDATMPNLPVQDVPIIENAQQQALNVNTRKHL
ncbi:MAG: hypothetical protein U1E92_02455 [Moraxella osloensis]